MKGLIATVTVLFFASYLNVKAQDPQFSQFYANPLSLNPAMAGTAQKYRATIVHRQQWTRSIGFATSAFSLDGSMGGGNSGWGVQVIKDSEANGVLKTTSFSGSFAHRISLSEESQIGMGLKLGIYQKALDWQSLTFEDQLDERDGIVNGTDERFGRDNVSNGDIAVGVLFSSKKMFAGVNVNHVNRPKEDFFLDSKNRLAMRYTFHAGGFIQVNDFRRSEQVVSPNIIFERQGSFSYWNLGMYYSSEQWVAGVWYRVNDAVIASIGVNLGSFRVGYSYDITVSEFSTINGNSHELTATYLFELPSKYKVKNRYRGKCPSFQKHLF